MKSMHSIFYAIMLALCLHCGAGVSFAQGTSLGTIRGTVVDPDGGAIPGANVQIIDLETNLSRTVTTNTSGNYEAGGLKYGVYKVTVSLQGFKTASVAEVALRGGDTLRTDVVLQAGVITEMVEVTTTSTINLETPTVSGQLTSKEIIDIPRDNRDIYSFLYLNPNISQGASDGQFKFIGAQSYGASFSLDGQRANGGIFGEPTQSQPSMETIGELTVLSNNFSAEYSGIANIRVTTKRGGKDYRGSLFYNNKNSALAAWSISDKRGQTNFTPTPARSAFPKPYFNLNETGGSFGGPVPFSKEKTFFLASYERRWNASPVPFSSQTLPHASLYTGDFSRLSAASRPAVPAGLLTPEEIADPNISVMVGTTRRFNKIPQRLLNPTTQAFIKNYFPATSIDAPINAANGRLVDYYENRSGLTTRHLGTLRIDHDLSEKDKFSAVYNIQPKDQATVPVVSPYVGLGLAQNEQTNHTLSLSYTRIFSDRIVNEARGGFNYQLLFRRSNNTTTSFLGNIGFDQSDIDAYYSVVGENARPTFGHIGVAFASTAFASIGTGGRNTFRKMDQKLFTFGDTLTWTTGNHTIKGGVDSVHNSAQDGFANNRGNPRGLLTYSGGNNADRFACFLLGLPANTAAYVDKLRPPMDVSNWEHGFFVQDDFKVNSKLTLFLGVRYDLVTPFIERNDLLVNFDPKFTDAATGRKGRFIAPSQKVFDQIDARIVAYGMVTADQAGVGRGLIKTDTNNIAPRIGAAWRLTEKSVLRGGYGIFYPTAAAQGMRDALATNPFNQARTKESQAATPLSGWPGGANGHGISPFSNGVVRTLGAQPAANAIPTDLQQPRIEQYNATFERELIWKTALRVSYLGTRSKGLIAGIDLNLLQPSATPFGTTIGDGVTACDPAVSGSCNLSPSELAQLPFPQLGSNLFTYGNFGRGLSHALQIEVNRRFANGFMFNTSYTMLDQKTTALDTGNSSLGGTSYNQFKPENDYGTDGFVSRHRFIVYGAIESPFGRGRKFGSSASLPVELVAGGWQLSWNMFAKSGYGFTPFWQCGNCSVATLGNVFSDSIDAVGGFTAGNSFRPIVSGNPNQRSGDRFFNPDAFALPPAGADLFDNPSVAKRNLLKGPGAWGANLGINKNFSFTERVKLRFGAEFNNILNHPLRPPAGTETGVSRLGTFNIRVNPTTKSVEIDPASLDRNVNFGRFFDSFSQESIDSRRTMRLTLRLTF